MTFSWRRMRSIIEVFNWTTEIPAKPNCPIYLAIYMGRRGIYRSFSIICCHHFQPAAHHKISGLTREFFWILPLLYSSFLKFSSTRDQMCSKVFSTWRSCQWIWINWGISQSRTMWRKIRSAEGMLFNEIDIYIYYVGLEKLDKNCRKRGQRPWNFPVFIRITNFSTGCGVNCYTTTFTHSLWQ